MASPVVVVKEPDRVFDDVVVVVVIYSLLVKLLDVEVVISFVVVIDSTTFVVLIKVGRLVVLLDLVVTISFVVVKAICPVAGMCHAIKVNVGLPKKYQQIQA